MQQAVRILAYPIVLGGCAAALIALATLGVPYWPTFPLIVAAGLTGVAVLERVLPYEPAWNRSHGDLLADVLHNLANHSLIQLTVATAFLLRQFWVPEPRLWPAHWPMWAQVLAAGALLDLSLYAMHRWSHVNRFLWRLHAIHHSPERLYWLNGERRHPLSALLLASPGVAALFLLGATAEAVSAWFAILTIHLAFQHSNLDYRTGPLKHVLGVAEVHRWHHKREYEDAQVNFGEFWMIWDHAFGSFHLGRQPLRAGEVGLRERDFPQAYAAQLLWPFAAGPAQRPSARARSAPPR
jgi:sterol desaturase/sphingolipid hydroxylase (fatty acid hydroxylase superfamily)